MSEPLELPALRTSHGKTYYLGGWQYRLVTHVGPIHVPDGRGGWLDPDLTFEPDRGGWRVRRALMGLSAPSRGVRATFTHEGAEVEIVLEAVGGKAPAFVPAEAGGREITWRGVAPGVDITLRADLYRGELWKSLASHSPRDLVWRVTTNDAGRARFQVMPRLFGKDRDGKPLHLTQETTKAEEVSPGVWSWQVTERFGGQTFATDPSTRVRSLLPEAATAWPVLIDPSVTLDIAANGDNGESRTDTDSWTDIGEVSGGYYGARKFGYSAARQNQPGFRFANVAIAQGVTINSATFTTQIRKVANTGSPDDPGFVYGDDVDDAAAWSSTSRPEQITKTTAKKAFNNPTGTGACSLDFTAIVQELVDRAGWASGNDMRFGFLAAYASPGTKIAYYGTRGDHYSDTPQLAVDYSSGTTVTPGAVASTAAVAAPSLTLTQAPAALSRTAGVVAPAMALAHAPAAVTSAGAVVSPAASLAHAPAATGSTAAVAAPAATLATAAGAITASGSVVAGTLAFAAAPNPVTAAGTVVAPTLAFVASLSPVAGTAAVVAPAVALSLAPAPVTAAGAVATPAWTVTAAPGAVTVAGGVVGPTVSSAFVVTPNPVTAAGAVAAVATALALSLVPVTATFGVPAVTTGDSALVPPLTDAALDFDHLRDAAVAFVFADATDFDFAHARAETLDF